MPRGAAPLACVQVLDYLSTMYTLHATSTIRGKLVNGADRVAVHYTCATDGDHIKALFTSVKVDITNKALAAFNLN